MKPNILIFNNKRFLHLVKREWNHHKSTMLIVFTSITGGFLIPLLLQFFGSSNIENPFNTQTLISSLTIMSVIFASLSFAETIKTSGRQNYLSIPASHLEKLSSKWIMTALIIPLAYILFFILFGTIVSVIIQFFTTQEIRSEGFSISTILQFLPAIYLAQSVFILGSVWKPKYSLIKTSFAVLLTLFAIGIFAFLVFRISFNEYFEGMVISDHNLHIDVTIDELLKTKFSRYTAGFILFLTFMTSALFKLREKEL